MATITITEQTSNGIALTLDDEDQPVRQQAGLIHEPVGSAAEAINPQTWPTDFRLVPSFRPINRGLDQTERPYGANLTERIFVTIMLRGVRMQSVSEALQSMKAIPNNSHAFTLFWEATGARWWPGLTRWPVGGEW